MMVFDLRSASEEDEYVRMIQFYDMDVDEATEIEARNPFAHLCGPSWRGREFRKW